MKWSSIAVIPLLALFFAGCDTLYQSDYRQAAPPYDARREALQSEMARQQAAYDLESLKAQSEAATRNLQRMEERLDRLEAESSRTAAARASELEGLRRELETLRADRDRLRREVVDDLSREMSRLLASQSAAPQQRATTATTPAKHGASGWEHKVEAGQTLSEISSAYKVPVARIMQANGLKSDVIRVGQTLFIPD